MTTAFIPLMMILRLMMMVVMGPRTGLAFHGWRLWHLLGRQLGGQGPGNLPEGCGRDAVGKKIHYGYARIRSLGKEGIQRNGTQERDLHHFGQFLPLVLTE